MTDPVSPYPSLSRERLGGRYLVEGLIGRGAASEVYRARDLWEDRSVAVKVLRAGAGDAVRFQKEVSLLRALRHDHLVSLCDAGEHRGLPYVVLDLLAGTVGDALAEGPLPWHDVARIGHEVAQALAYVHAAGIVHRDVKPSNLLLASDGSARLADLGAARLVDGGRLTATGMTIGTPAYLAPEQVTGADVGPAADVYALGLVLIEVASGERAFTGTHQELLAARTTRPPAIPAAVPARWRDLLVAMTALDPAQRPTAAAVAERLDPRVPPAATAETEVLPVAGGAGGLVGGAVGEDGEGTEVLPARPLGSSPHAAVAWLDGHRSRVALWAVLAAVLLALAAGLASAGGGSDGPVPAASTTPSSSTTTGPPTTKSTAAAVPAAPAGTCEADGCEGQGDDEGEQGHKPGKGAAGGKGNAGGKDD